MLPPAAGEGPPDDLPADAVALVREYKGPTVEHVLDAEDEALDQLPGRVAAVEQAIESPDLGAADERLDRALGSLLPGPGSDPAPGRRRAWLWGVLVVALVGVIGWLTFGLWPLD